jgi:threonine/homoserine/homoserine lactone efflux protein
MCRTRRLGSDGRSVCALSPSAALSFSPASLRGRRWPAGPDEGQRLGQGLLPRDQSQRSVPYAARAEQAAAPHPPYRHPLPCQRRGRGRWGHQALDGMMLDQAYFQPQLPAAAQPEAMDAIPMFEYSTLHWVTFFSTAFLLTISPGPDIAFILGQTITGGRKSGFAAMLGVWGGTIGHIIMAVVGLSALIAASSLAFTAIKWIGVGYLIWLGLNALRSTESSFSADIQKDQKTFGRIFWRGAFTTLLNPKVAIFFVAFLPQFVVLGAGPTWAQLLLHGLLLICVAALIEPLLVLAGERLTAKLRGNKRVGLWLDRSLGAIFIALGVRLAFEVR